MNTARQLHHLNAWERKPVRRMPEFIPARLPALEGLLPSGGWPKGEIVEIIAPDEHTDVMPLVIPALVPPGLQDRWLGLVAPPYLPRASLLSAPGVDATRILQINPHTGRSGLWTLEQMLGSGNFSIVMAWPACDTELMARRLQRAAIAGNTLGILFRTGKHSKPASRIGLRLKLEADETGRVVYLVDRHGNRQSGTAVVS